MADHLIIDGYNVLYAWPDLRRQMKRSFDGARCLLVEAVRVIRSVEGSRMTLVFDGKGEELDVEHPGEDPGFVVLFAPKNVSADGLIEQIVRKAKYPEQCQVISRDLLLLESIRATGAYGYPPEALADQVRRCEERQRLSIAAQSKSNHKEWAGGSPWSILSMKPPKTPPPEPHKTPSQKPPSLSD